MNFAISVWLSTYREPQSRHNWILWALGNGLQGCAWAVGADINTKHQGGVIFIQMFSAYWLSPQENHSRQETEQTAVVTLSSGTLAMIQEPPPPSTPSLSQEAKPETNPLTSLAGAVPCLHQYRLYQQIMGCAHYRETGFREAHQSPGICVWDRQWPWIWL